MTDRRPDKPVELKTLRRTAETADLLAHLEGRPRSHRARSRRAIWTREFLASGKIGKAPG